jgi:YD repeat-containing protein
MMRLALLFIAFGSVHASAIGQAPVDFARDVLPILSDACFHCHGPDEGARKAKLRLDTKDGAFRERNGITTIVPGKSGESELVRRILSNDTDEQMPPPNSNRKLTAKQIETLKKWVDSGAAWGRHWAFEPIARQPANRSIDSFIRERLAKEGMKPSPLATRESWIRRVTFDLTGLPPTLVEIDAFLKDQSPQAFERVVDRLLASPRYGERMAADWLDVARFADTHGYQMDRHRPVWPYRDWVIKAFNENKSYDRFVTEQLAGDLLPNATKDQILATAFNRLHMQNEEGGVVEEEFRVAYVNDRVTTFGTAFLGLTLECTRCHDHKYDPLTQKDFYSLFAFFQNIDEAGQTSYFTSATPVPALLLSTKEQDAKLAALRQQVAEKEAALIALNQSAWKAFDQWQRPKSPTLKDLVAHYPFDTFEKYKSTNAIDVKLPAVGSDGPTLVPGKHGKAVKLSGENGFTFPGVGHFTKSDPFTISLWIRPADHAPRAVVLHHSRAPVDAGSRGYELLLEDGRVAFGLHHMWPGNSLKVRTVKPIPVNEWTLVTVTYDGSSRPTGITIATNGILHTREHLGPVYSGPMKTNPDLEIVRDCLEKDITYEGGEPDLALGYRFRDNGFKNGEVDDLRIFNRCLTPLEVKHLAGVESDQQLDWLQYFRSAEFEPQRKAIEELRVARRALAAYLQPIPEIMAMKELPVPKPAFILKRGQYDSPGEPVSMSTPKELPPFTAELPRNRLGLAKWLTRSDNPLFARVAVNRIWQQMFGAGLVETSDNFGTQGTAPSHPELLDWLAADFAANGWDMKRMLKQIALSKTYRQSSNATPEQRERDPTNTLLGRYPVRRLSAEMIRDQALAVSGLLVEKQGGPSVKPYQPEGLWDLSMGKPKYDRSKGDDLYRRSLYTYVKRTAPHPQQMTFDAADRSNCTVRRQATSTPLQALALLNDVQIGEAARILAEKVIRESKSEEERVQRAFRIVTGRIPGEKETAVLMNLLRVESVRLGKDEQALSTILSVGDRKADPALPKLDIAALAEVCLVILNHDEAVNLR